jgi:hypothetical protein
MCVSQNASIYDAAMVSWPLDVHRYTVMSAVASNTDPEIGQLVRECSSTTPRLDKRLCRAQSPVELKRGLCIVVRIFGFVQCRE